MSVVFFGLGQENVSLSFRKNHKVTFLPEKHGRLVDADRLRVMLCRMKENYLPELDEAAWAIGWAIEALDRLETIVEEEE